MRCLWQLALAVVVAASGSSSQAQGHTYDYEDIVAQYCHTAMDWGELPERPPKADGLLQVQVFIRHGARVLCNAETCWPGDREGNFTCDSLAYLENSLARVSGTDTVLGGPYFKKEYLAGRNQISGNCLTGQLVKAGYEQEVHNGARLREAYVKKERFLPNQIEDAFAADLSALFRLRTHALFRLRSTDIPRTWQSGMSLFGGMYGDLNSASPLSYLTMDTMDFAKENMIPEHACPAGKKVKSNFFASLPTENKTAIKEMCELYAPPKYKVRAAGLSKCFWWLQHLIDCLMSRVCPNVPFTPHNSTIPRHFLEGEPALLRRLWRLVDGVQWEYFRAMARVGTGPFIAEVLEAADAAVEGGSSESAAKFLLFSGHDTGPMEPLWAALSLRDGPPFWPPFASMTILEVWSSPAGPLVRWISNGKVVRDTQPYEEFRTEAKALVPSPEECQGEDEPEALAVAKKVEASKAAVQGMEAHSNQPVSMAVLYFVSGALSAVLIVVVFQRLSGSPLRSPRWGGVQHLPHEPDEEDCCPRGVKKDF